MTTVTLYQNSDEESGAIPLTLDLDKLHTEFGQAFYREGYDLTNYPLQQRITGDTISSGQTYNDHVSSIRILSTSSGSTPSVTLYGNINYDNTRLFETGGGGGGFNPFGQTDVWQETLTGSTADLGDQDNRLSSIWVTPGTVAYLYPERDYIGVPLVLTASNADLTKKDIPQSWNDQASAVSVQGGTATFYGDVVWNQGPDWTHPIPDQNWSVQLKDGHVTNFPIVKIPGVPLTLPVNDQLSSVGENTAALSSGGTTNPTFVTLGGQPPSGSAQVPAMAASPPVTMSFLPATDASQTTLAQASGQTLVGSSQFGDTFRGTSEALNGDLIKLFGGNDAIDVTDLNFWQAALSYSGTSTAGTLSLTDGVHKARISLTGGFHQENFYLASDMHGGTNVTYG